MTVTSPVDISSLSLGGSRLTEAAYTKLSQAIVEGQLKPGQQLLETALARDLGVSRTPAREAIHLLIRDGMAEAVGGKVVVTRLTVKAVRDLHLVNQVLMKTSCRLAAVRGTAEQMAILEGLTAEMELAAGHHDLFAWKDYDRRFHLQIGYMADNATLTKMVSQMGFQLARVRHLAILQPGRLEQSIAEHRKVVEAIKRRDADLAERAIEDHMKAGEQVVIQILENFVVPFKGNLF